MKHNFFLMVIMLMFILFPLYTQGILSVNVGGLCVDEEEIIMKPDAGILTGFDYFTSITESISFFTSIGGSFNYRYLDEEWNYLYNGSTQVSFRNDNILFKPSITLTGEHLYTTELTGPHIWENSCDLYFSYDFKESSIFVDPALSWENDNYFLKGKTGYVFSFLNRNVLSLELSGGKTLFESANNEFFIYPRILYSWYPDKPYTLTISSAFTWYDSDYTSLVGETEEFIPTLDFMEFLSDIEFSTIINEQITLTLYAPFSFLLKRHKAVDEDNENFLDEDEWIFFTGLQVDVGIDFHPSHRCLISISGEKSFSNSIYQESGELILSLAYEFVF